MHRKSEYGRGTYETEFEGIINNLERRFRDTSSSWIKEEIESYMSAVPCDACGGKRLSKESLAVTVGGKNISDFCDLSVVDALAFLDTLTLTPREEMIAAAVLKEIRSRLGFLRNVGLEYLTLSRAAATLSGGESQRIRLATNIGSSLMGVLYILDEPSIGLHQRDNHKLLSTLMRLRDLGNTVIVVEHDEDTMLAADHIVDIGPGAGIHGGNVIYSGDVQGILKCPESITGQYLSGQRFIPVPQTRREGNGKKITIVGAQQNNLKNVTVDIPLGKLVCITGVSGSGKSSLINRLCKGGNAGKAAVQDKPGVTRRNQWFTIGKGLELLDTPGVLWPKFEDPVVGEHLAFTGAVRDEILDIEGLSYRLLELLQDLYPEAVNTRYKTDIRPEEELKGHEILERIGRKRGMLISGGEIDTERAAVNVLDEYRGGKLGRITLEPVGRPLK